MKIMHDSIEQIRQRMGSEATNEDARKMIALLEGAGIDDTDSVSDQEWFRLVAEACSLENTMKTDELLAMGRAQFDREQAALSRLTSATDAQIEAILAEQNQHLADMFGSDDRPPEEVREQARRSQDALDKKGREDYAREWALAHRANYCGR